MDSAKEAAAGAFDTSLSPLALSFFAVNQRTGWGMASHVVPSKSWRFLVNKTPKGT